MGKQLVVVVVFLSMLAFPEAESKHWKTRPVDDWRKSLGLGKEKVSHLHFFFHDTLSGKTPSAVRIAEAPAFNHSATLFGVLMMADDPLTEGPEPTSKLLGRAQGIYGSAGQGEVSLLMAMAYSFTHGRYNGSSISIMGKNPALNPVREMPIVGGTGLFRFARGVAMAKTHWFNITTGDAIVEYNMGWLNSWYSHFGWNDPYMWSWLERTDIPDQENFNDCGVFAMAFATYCVHRLPFKFN